MNPSYAEAITKFPLFEGHTVFGAQSMLDRGKVLELAPSQVICKEGDPASFVLLVLSGKVQVYVERNGHPIVLTEAGPGSVLGELAVLCGIPRAASLRAGESCAVLEWENESFRRMLLSNALLSQRILGQSLRTLIDKERDLINALAQKDAESSKTD